ncbi:ATP-binding protein [Deinococcus sp. VB142]|uniref:ATP-binding protein n=1 Tax=Deinococcus sp. VB142 TaxID=3112952 RepID=A0AAU6Q1D5_9DEIO
MSRVVFMCGPAGSGKSTYARKLEAQGMTRLSFDGAAWERGLTVMPLPPEVHAEIKRELQERLLTLVRAGQDVVLDFSFHSRQMRDEYRGLLAPLGVVPETVYLATDRETVLRRVRERQAGHADDFQLTEELAAQYFDGFEMPTEDEGPLLRA